MKLRRRLALGAVVVALGSTAVATGPFQVGANTPAAQGFLTGLGLPVDTPITDVGCAPINGVCTSSIQAAIDAVPAGRPTVVRLAAGQYRQNVLIENRTVHLVGSFEQNPVWIDGFGVAPSMGTRYGLIVRNAPGSSVRNIAVRRFSRLAHGEFQSAISIDRSNGVLVKGVTSVDNSYSGIGAYQSSGVVFDDLLIKRNDALGISGWMANNLIIRDSVIERNTDLPRFQDIAEQYRESAGIKITESAGVKIERNTVAENGSTGIWTDVGTRDSEIAYNTVVDNLWFGIETEISYRILVHHNTILHNASGNSIFPSPRHAMMVLDSVDISIVANTIRHRKGDTELGWSQALRIAETPWREVHPRIGQPPTDTSGTVLAYNEIQQLSPTGSIMGIFDERGVRNASHMIARSDANYFRRAPRALFASDTAGLAATVNIGNSNDATTLDAWRRWRCAAICREHNSVLATDR